MDMVEIIKLLIPALGGGLVTVMLLLIFPDVRRARVGREEAESDSIQLGAIGEVLLSMTQNLATTSAMVQSNANGYAEALKKVADSNIEMLTFVREKEIQISEERHILVARIEELSIKVRQLDDEKSQLEDDLLAAKIKIEKLETDSSTQSKELKQLERDYKKLKADYETLKLERDNLLLQMSKATMPQLEADNLTTHILSKDGKDETNSSSIHVVVSTGDTASS